MNKFILTLGKFLINFGVILQLFAIIALSIFASIYTSEIFVGIGTFIALIIFAIMYNFLLYLIINTHDNFSSIAESLRIIAKNKN